MSNIELSIPTLKVIRDLWNNSNLDYDLFYDWYKNWVSDDVFIHFTNSDNEMVKFLAPKRGNVSYMRRSIAKFNKVFSMIGNRVSVVGKSNLVMFTATYSPKYGLLEAWKRTKKDFNLFMVRLKRYIRKIFPNMGEFEYIKVCEAQNRGYPHFHLLFYIPEFKPTFQKYDKKNKLRYRFTNFEFVNAIKDCWKHGFTDVLAGTDIQDGFDYLFKYITKNVEYVKNKTNTSLIMLWLHNKRSFSMSQSLSRLYRRLVDGVKPKSTVFLGISFKNGLFVNALDFWATKRTINEAVFRVKKLKQSSVLPKSPISMPLLGQSCRLPQFNSLGDYANPKSKVFNPARMKYSMV